MILTDKKIIGYKKISALSRKFKKQGKKTVLVTGCYDILHTGHLIFFNDVKRRGDVLIVGLGSDQSVRALKGPHRPINNEKLRSRLLAGLAVVDFVVICHEKLVHWNIDHSKLIDILKPDIYVVPMTDKQLKKKREMAESAGAKFVTCRRLPPNHIKGGISSTQIEQKLSAQDN